jgi:hypothetical protein
MAAIVAELDLRHLIILVEAEAALAEQVRLHQVAVQAEMEEMELVFQLQALLYTGEAVEQDQFILTVLLVVMVV